MHCYYCTSVTESGVARLFTHYVTEHRHGKLSIRQLTLNDQNGELLFLKSVHFPLSVDTIQKIITQGDKCVIDITNAHIRFKRAAMTDVTEGAGDIHVLELRYRYDSKKSGLCGRHRW